MRVALWRWGDLGVGADPRRATRERKEEGRKENRKCSPRCRHDKKQNDKKARIKNRQDLLLSSTFPPYTLLRPHKAEGLERQHGGDIQGEKPTHAVTWRA